MSFLWNDLDPPALQCSARLCLLWTNQGIHSTWVVSYIPPLEPKASDLARCKQHVVTMCMAKAIHHGPSSHPFRQWWKEKKAASTTSVDRYHTDDGGDRRTAGNISFWPENDTGDKNNGNFIMILIWHWHGKREALYIQLHPSQVTENQSLKPYPGKSCQEYRRKRKVVKDTSCTHLN